MHAPAHAQLGLLFGQSIDKSASKTGFAFPTDKPASIAVFRPDVSVGEQSTGGLNEPNAEWTETAKKLLNEALVSSELTQKHNITFLPEYDGGEGRLVADYTGLFEAVILSVVQHKLFPGNRLPTKKKQDGLDWSLGEGTQQLAEISGSDYGLFFLTNDSYGSGGRKALQIVGLLAGFGVQSGVHVGYAGLVDLRSGDLLWMNADLAMGGDVRKAEGAQKRVGQLLKDFPPPQYTGEIAEPKFITTEVQVGDAEPSVSGPIEQGTLEAGESADSAAEAAGEAAAEQTADDANEAAGEAVSDAAAAPANEVATSAEDIESAVEAAEAVADPADDEAQSTVNAGASGA